MPKKKGKKKGGKKKGGPKQKDGPVLDVPDYVNNDEELDDYFLEADYGPKKKTKKFTGFENVESRPKRKVETLSEEEVVSSTRKSKAQLKREKKARQKKKAEEEARKKAEEARKKEEEQLSDEPLPKKKKKKKYYSDDESWYSDEEPLPKKKKTTKKKYDDYSDDYSDHSDDPLPKKKKTKKKYSDDDYSDYSDDPLPKKKKTKAKKKKYSDDDDYSDYSDDLPKKKKSSKKKKYSDDDWSDYSDDPPKKKSKKKSKYSDDDFSDYSDEPRSKKKKTTAKKSRKYSDDYSDYSSDEPVSKKKSKKGKARKYSDSFSDYSDDEPVSKKKKSPQKSKYSDDDDYSDELPKKKVKKKDLTKSAGPNQRALSKRKKAAKKKGKWAAFEELDDFDDEPEPVKKSAPTMSDDSDSAEFVRSKKKKEEPKKNVNLWDALMDDSESEDEDDGGFDFGKPVKKEATPPPVVAKATPNWKKKKEKKKEKEDDEFDFFKEEPKQLTKAQKKRQRQKERKEAEDRAAELAKASGQDVNQDKEKTEEPAQAVDPDKPPEGLSKAALKRWKKKHRKNQAQNQSKQLTEAQKKRMAKFEEEQRKKKEAEEERLREEEEERMRKEQEERIQAERQAEADKRRAEKNKRLRLQKHNKKRGNTAKLRGVQNVDKDERRRLAAERKAQREAKKKNNKNKKSQNNKLKAQEEDRRRQEEAEKDRLAEIQRQKEESEAKKKAEAEANAEKERQEKLEREERNRRITEMAAQALAKKRGVDDDSDDDWESAEVARARAVQKNNNQWGETESNPWDDDESSDQEPPAKKTWDDDESEDEKPPAKKANNCDDDDESDDEPEPPKKKDNNWDDDESDDEPEPSKKEGKTEDKTSKTDDPDQGVDWSDSSEEEVETKKVGKKKGKKKRKGKKGKKAKEIDLTKLRAPIGVIMGNVNAGKTALLDYIRGTKVQEGEAGGITQQIGATNLPMDDIIAKAGEEVVKNMLDEVHLPGLLVIDTPGHAAFDNLRERGSAMCDIAIVVVNIFNGMEGTTAECVNMLKENKAPFMIALNQIDRLTEWKSFPGVPINKAIEQQSQQTQSQFRDLFMKVRADFAALCHLNADLFWESKDLQKNRLRSDNINVVPTSAFSGDGVSDLLLLWVKMSQIPKIAKKLVVKPKLRCTVLEVNKIQGYGHTLDVIISDGYLKCGQTVVCCGMNGPVITKIRALLTPKATQDLRVKILEYTRHTKICASSGVRVVTVEDASSVIPGSKIMVVNPGDQDEVEDVVDEVMAGLEELKSIEKSDKGVYVVASTLGSLQALVKFVCDKVNVPICGTSIGRVYKKDVMKAMVMLEKKPEWAIILAFDVDVDSAAAELAEYEGIRIFTAPIIYHLKSMFEQYIEEVKENARAEIKEKVVFPVLMTILDSPAINRKNPIILGMQVKKGTLRMNTPLCAFRKEDQKVVFLGRVTGIQYEGADKETAKKDEKVSVKIDLTTQNDTIIEFGRHFTKEDRIISRSTRESFEILKTFFRTETTQEDLRLLKMLQKIFPNDW